MIGDIQLHDIAPQLAQCLGLGANLHSVFDRRMAGGGIALAAHSFGMSTPDSRAARRMLVPALTVAGRPSIVILTVSATGEAGVPRSAWRTLFMRHPHSGRKVFGEVF